MEFSIRGRERKKHTEGKKVFVCMFFPILPVLLRQRRRFVLPPGEGFRWASTRGGSMAVPRMLPPLPKKKGIGGKVSLRKLVRLQIIDRRKIRYCGGCQNKTKIHTFGRERLWRHTPPKNGDLFACDQPLSRLLATCFLTPIPPPPPSCKG